MTTPTELRMLTALRSMKALEGMATSHLKKLAALATPVKFAQDQIIYPAGVLGEAIYFIEAGEVVIEMSVSEGSSPVKMYTVGPGHLFGWSALFPPRRKQARARAVVATQVIAINAAGLRAAFQFDQGLENAMIQRVNEVIAERLAATRQQLAHAFQVEAR
ncbi:MAG: cyclic nucleotide-binding domain-containing protein [Chloroflexi bacterium]|nr:cyclic nucleotide-binding domain-containing protein [Chloroflexota bacterium]